MNKQNNSNSLFITNVYKEARATVHRYFYNAYKNSANTVLLKKYFNYETIIMPKVVFKYPDGTIKEIDADNGLSLLEVAHQNDISIEGACEGSLACSTCHVIVDQTFFDKLEDATEDEEDMLDLAFGLTPTSRLGCQIRISDELDGLTVTLPESTNNMIA